MPIDSKGLTHVPIPRSRLVRAWQLLQQHDGEGNAKGALPYTEEALEEFTAAHVHDPEDLAVVHHLAIAHHARAWDMELRGEVAATEEWERALALWSRLASASEFWNALRAKLLACDSNAPLSPLLEVRRNLLESLLDVHVDFVRLYCERNSVDRAAIHMGIVARSKLPPGVKKHLVGKVFAVLTNAIPEAKASRAFGPALTILERFLTLYPDYLPALRAHAEVCAEWVSALSYRDNWTEIEHAGSRAEPAARMLGGHPELASDPLAKTVLEELTRLLICRGHDRAGSIFAACQDQLDDSQRDMLRATFAFAIRWGRLARECACATPPIRFAFADCLLNEAKLICDEGIAVMESRAVDKMTKLDTVIGLLEKAIVILEEADSCATESESLQNHIESRLTECRDTLRELQKQKSLAAFFHPGGDNL